MRNMRKLLAALLIAAMLLSLAVSVLAVGELTLSDADDMFFSEQSSGDLKSKPGTELKAEGKLYGFFLNAQNNAGFGDYDLASNKLTVYENTFPYYIYSGTYVMDDNGGAYYGTYNNGSNFVLARIDDIVTGDYEDLCTVPEQMLAMAVSYANNTVYAMSRSGYLYTVNVEQGVFKKHVRLTGTDDNPFVMTIDNNGDMYIVSLAGTLYTANITTGRCTYVGPTGIDPGAVQSMVYDYNTDTVYWFFYLMTNQSGVCTVDRETGATKVIGSLNSYEGLGVFSIPKEITLPDPVDITGITMEPTQLNLVGGQKEQLYTTVLPEDKYIADRSVTWTTTDASVAEISDAGIVTARHAGTATVTATTSDGKYSASCTVTVESAETHYRDLSDILNYAEYGNEGWVPYHTDENAYPFRPENASGVGTVAKSSNAGKPNTQSWVETVYPMHMTGGSSVSFDYRVNCASSDRLALYVNDTPVWSDTGDKNWDSYTYTVKKTGDYTFKWSYEKGSTGAYGLDAAMLVNIEYNILPAEELREITLTPASVNMLVNMTQQLEVGYVPANIENPNVTFVSDNTAVATVNAEGVVVSRSVGTANITVTSEDGAHTASTTVNVLAPSDVSKLNFTPVEVNNEYPFTLESNTAQYFDHNGTTKYAEAFSIDVKSGEAVIFTLKPGEKPIYDTLLLVYNKDFELVESNDDDGSYDMADGYSRIKFIPEEEGTYYIVATTVSSYLVDHGDAVLAVEGYEPVHVEGITVPGALTLGVGKYLRLNAALKPENTDFPGITYESSDPSVVTVDENGLMYGVKEGTAEVTATSVDGGYSGTCTVYVEKLPVPEPDGNIYAYNMNDLSGKTVPGFVKLNTAADTVELLMEDRSGYYAGVHRNGMLYGYSIEVTPSAYYINFTKIDTDDYTVQDVRKVNGKMMPIDMTYDPITDKVYASVINADTNGNNALAEINLDTGAVTVIARFGLAANNLLLHIEADAQGVLYGVTMEGKLYTIDKNSAQLNEVANLGTRSSYISTMSYDNNEKRIYWFPIESGYGYIVKFDPVTGKVERKTRFNGSNGYELTFGFNFSDPEALTHTVEFLGMNHELVATVTVVDGGAAKAPDMTREDGVPFGMWDSEFDRVVSDMTVQGYYVGDVNMNAQIDAGDATMMLRAVVGSGELTEDQAFLADANENSGIDAADATIVLRYIVGIGWTTK